MSDNFSIVQTFRHKYQCKPIEGHPCVEFFLCKLGKELFIILQKRNAMQCEILLLIGQLPLSLQIKARVL